MVSTFGSLAASPLPRAMLFMAAKVHALRCGRADRSPLRQRRVTKRRRRCPASGTQQRQSSPTAGLGVTPPTRQTLPDAALATDGRMVAASAGWSSIGPVWPVLKVARWGSRRVMGLGRGDERTRTVPDPRCVSHGRHRCSASSCRRRDGSRVRDRSGPDATTGCRSCGVRTR